MRAISSRACPTPRAFSPWPVCALATGTPHAGIVLPEWLVSSSVSSRLPQEHSGTAVSLVGPRLRSQPSAASLLRKFQSLPSPPPPLWHPAYADSSASRQTARWTHVNKGLQASMSSASTSSSYCLKNEVYKIKNQIGQSCHATTFSPAQSLPRNCHRRPQKSSDTNPKCSGGSTARSSACAPGTTAPSHSPERSALPARQSTRSSPIARLIRGRAGGLSGGSTLSHFRPPCRTGRSSAAVRTSDTTGPALIGRGNGHEEARRPPRRF